MKKTQVFLGAALALLLAAACANPLTGPLPGAGSTVTLRADFGSAQGRSLLTSGVNKVEVTYLNAGAPTGVAPILLTDNGSGVWTGQLTLAANGNTQFFMAAYADDEILYTGSKQQTLLGDGSDVVAIEAVELATPTPGTIELAGYLLDYAEGWIVFGDDQSQTYYATPEPDGRFKLLLTGTSSALIHLTAFYDLNGNGLKDGPETVMNLRPILKTPAQTLTYSHAGKDSGLFWAQAGIPEIPNTKTVTVSIPPEAVPDGSPDYTLKPRLIYQGPEQITGYVYGFYKNQLSLYWPDISADQTAVELPILLPPGLTGTFAFEAVLFDADNEPAGYAIGFIDEVFSSTNLNLTLQPSVAQTLQGRIIHPNASDGTGLTGNLQVGLEASAIDFQVGPQTTFVTTAPTNTLLRIGAYADLNESGYEGDWAGWFGTSEVTAGNDHWILVTGDRADLEFELQSLTEGSEVITVAAPGHGFPANTTLQSRVSFGLPDSSGQNNSSITVEGTSTQVSLKGLNRTLWRPETEVRLWLFNNDYSGYSEFESQVYTAEETNVTLTFEELVAQILIAGIEVSGAVDTLYALVGSPGMLGLSESWSSSAETTPLDYQMQVVGGTGSMVFNTPQPITETGSFKLREINSWNIQIGSDYNSTPQQPEGSNFSISNLSLPTTSGVYILKLEVSFLTAKQFAVASFHLGSDVTSPHGITGPQPFTSPPYPVLRLGALRIINAPSNTKYFVTGESGVIRYGNNRPLFNQDYQRFEGNENPTFQTITTNSLGSGFLFLSQNYFLLQESKYLRLDRALDEEITTGVAASFNSSTALVPSGTMNFSEVYPVQPHELTYDAAAGTWSVKYLKTKWTVPVPVFDMDASPPEGVTYSKTLGTSEDPSKAKVTLTFTNLPLETPLTLIGSNLYPGVVSTPESWNVGSAELTQTPINGTVSWTFWYTPDTSIQNWGNSEVLTPAGAESIFQISLPTGGLVIGASGASNSNMFVGHLGAGNSAEITVDLSNFE